MGARFRERLSSRLSDKDREQSQRSHLKLQIWNYRFRSAECSSWYCPFSMIDPHHPHITLRVSTSTCVPDFRRHRGLDAVGMPKAICTPGNFCPEVNTKSSRQARDSSKGQARQPGRLWILVCVAVSQEVLHQNPCERHRNLRAAPLIFPVPAASSANPRTCR